MRRYLTYANVTATLALVFAMSGGALAAKHYLLSSTKQISPKVLEGLSHRDEGTFKALAKTVVVSKADSATTAGSAGTAGSATTAASANTAGSANTAATATTANNALELGGTPASEFTHSDCNSRTGQVKGFVTINASAAVPSEFTPVAGAYNCSGQPVEVKRLGEGRYVVKFVGNPAGIAVATSNADHEGGTPLNLVAVTTLTGGEYRISDWNVPTATFKDESFNLMMP
jgi:hypothetical protein